MGSFNILQNIELVSNMSTLCISNNYYFMAKKTTIAALRIRQEMNNQSLTASDLASRANIDFYAVNNIISGKSSKIEKLEAIANALGKPLMYFVNSDFNNDSTTYNADLHCKIVKVISDICKKDKISLAKHDVDKLVDFTYPRLNKNDPDELMLSQTEAVVKYYLKNSQKIT